MRTAEVAPDADELASLVARAQAGDAEALEGIVRAIQHDVYRLALRMTASVEDAEDATQEVLIKVITRLESFRGDASVRTWAYRIAVRHVLDRRKSRVEELRLTFDAFGADLLDGLAATPEPDPVLIAEVKRGCTLAMLTCLDREHRLAFVLADVFDLSHREAAGLCDVGEDVHRQRLSRARRALEAFTAQLLRARVRARPVPLQPPGGAGRGARSPAPRGPGSGRPSGRGRGGVGSGHGGAARGGSPHAPASTVPGAGPAPGPGAGGDAPIPGLILTA